MLQGKKKKRASIDLFFLPSLFVQKKSFLTENELEMRGLQYYCGQEWCRFIKMCKLMHNSSLKQGWIASDFPTLKPLGLSDLCTAGEKIFPLCALETVGMWLWIWFVFLKLILNFTLHGAFQCLQERGKYPVFWKQDAVLCHSGHWLLFVVACFAFVHV